MIYRVGSDSTAWHRPVKQLYALLEEHGESALRESMATALSQVSCEIAQVVRALRSEQPLSIGADPHPGDAASAEIFPSRSSTISRSRPHDAANVLYAVVDARYQLKLPTIFTTNKPSGTVPAAGAGGVIDLAPGL